MTHVRGVMHRLFDAAWRAEIIESNPVSRVRTPRVREVRKERVILTDSEFEQLIACAEVDLELRMASTVARCEGGMRTGDLLRWDWGMIDRAAFAERVIPRSKTGTPQVLAIPPSLSPVLRAWWAQAGYPDAGAVFPARRGKRAGDFKRANGYTFAKRLRAALFRAGVWRLEPEVPNTSPGTRTDLGCAARGTKLAPNPSDPLYFETAVTRPVDFHSFRRAFNTALGGGRDQRADGDGVGGPLGRANAHAVRDEDDGDADHPGGGAAAALWGAFDGPIVTLRTIASIAQNKS
jgi:integrase